LFLDDILTFSKDPTKHAQHLTVVLETLRKHGYFARLRKCSFAETTVEFLGHVISYNIIAMDKEKLQGVQDWPRPTTIKQVRGFLGLARYYCRFIKDFATMAAPLHDLTQHDKIKTSEHWVENCTTAFEAIKTAPVLALPDITKPLRHLHGCFRDCYWRTSSTSRGGSGPSACLLPLKEAPRCGDKIRGLGAGALRFGHSPQRVKMQPGGDHIYGLHGSQESDNVDDTEETQEPAGKLAGGDLVLPSQHRLPTR
jgi:hypothetical protein